MTSAGRGSPRHRLLCHVSFGLGLVVLVLDAGVAFAQKTPSKPQPLQGVELQRAIDRAIERGVTALSDSAGADQATNELRPKYPVGYSSLLAYALIESGEDPRRARIRGLISESPSGGEGFVYCVSLTILALDAHAELVDLSAAQKRRMSNLAAWLVERQREDGYWGYGFEEVSDRYTDLSNTQFAALGLAAAERHGVQVPAPVWLRLRQTLVDSTHDLGPSRPLRFDGVGWGPEIPELTEAERERRRKRTTPLDPALEDPTPLGWSYRLAESNTRPSMVSAGISTLLLARDRVSESFHPTLDQRLFGSLTGLSTMLGEITPDPTDTVHENYYYTIYSLEKALDLAGCERLAGVDWYEHHANILIREQADDGFWGRPSKPEEFRETSTAFALLFLNRATIRHRRGKVFTGAGSVEAYGYEQGHVLLPGGRRGIDLDDLFARLATSSSGRLEAIARGIVERATRFEAPYLLPRLSTLRRDGARDLSQWAAAEQRRITGLAAKRATLDVVDAWHRDWLELQRVRREKPKDADVQIAAIWDPNSSAELRRHALEVWSALGRFESASFLIARLPSMDEMLAARAHKILVLLTGERELEKTPAANRESVWTASWKNRGGERRAGSAFAALAEQLETATTPDEIEAVRSAIVALGEAALPQIEKEIAKPKFRTDWLLIRERITGERRGF